MSLVQPLENGYYLSVYGMIDELAFLSNNYVRHDFAIALWYRKEHDITLTRYWEMERLTGYKSHDCAFYNIGYKTDLGNKAIFRLFRILQFRQVWRFCLSYTGPFIFSPINRYYYISAEEYTCLIS